VLVTGLEGYSLNTLTEGNLCRISAWRDLRSTRLLLSFNIFPVFTGIVADSVAIELQAQVMAVVMQLPHMSDYTINLLLLGRIKIKYMALVYLFLPQYWTFAVNSGGN